MKSIAFAKFTAARVFALCAIWLFVTSGALAQNNQPVPKKLAAAEPYWLVSGAGLYRTYDLCGLTAPEEDQSVLESVIFSSIAVANLADAVYRSYSVEDLANNANDFSYEIEKNFLSFQEHLQIINLRHENKELDCQAVKSELADYLQKARSSGVAITAQTVAYTLAGATGAKSLFRAQSSIKGGV